MDIVSLAVPFIVRARFYETAGIYRSQIRDNVSK